MGSSETKDPHVDVYFQVDRPYYQAGQKVDGNVYIVARMNVNYDALYVRLYGHEQVYWTEYHSHGQHGGHTEVYNKKKDTYTDEFILFNFNGQIQAGHYTFPFSMTLPHGLTGTFEKDSDNYIKYELSAYLTSFKEKKDKQTFTKNLTIL